MLTLALETTADLCSVALLDGRGVVVERAYRHRMHLSERLLGDVQAVLADAGCALGDVEGFAVGVGPGSFTGVRVGVMTVKTWGYALGKPVVGVSALDAVAEEYRGASDTVTALIRARPGWVYARAFQQVGEAWGPISEARMAAIPEVIAEMAASPETRRLVCGDGLRHAAAELADALREHGPVFALGRADPPRASVVGALGEARLRAGAADDPLGLSPLYLAPPPVDPGAEARIRSQKAMFE